jgi:hypothetical protein
MHDLASTGAALIVLDAVPVERLEGADVPVMVLNGATTMSMRPTD